MNQLRLKFISGTKFKAEVLSYEHSMRSLDNRSFDYRVLVMYPSDIKQLKLCFIYAVILLFSVLRLKNAKLINAKHMQLIVVNI